MRGLDRLWALHETIKIGIERKDAINANWLLNEIRDCYEEIFEDGMKYYGEIDRRQGEEIARNA